MIFAFLPVVNAETNVSILYGWNGTNFVPVQVTSGGAIKTDINMTQAVGLFPKVNNTYDLGSLTRLWANLYVRSIRGGSGPLSLFAGENEIITLLASGNVGIGTTSPGAQLEVSGTNSLNNISLNVNNTLYVNNSLGGRVGIGTASPIATLSVIGNVSATSFIGNAENLTNIPVTNVSLNYGWNATNFVPLLTTADGTLQLNIRDAQSTNASNLVSGATGSDLTLSRNLTVMKNLSVGTTTLFVDQTGTRIGIATASPAATLEVSGTNTVNNISLNVNNTLYVNNSGGGNVGIGTTGPTSLLSVVSGGVAGSNALIRSYHPTYPLGYSYLGHYSGEGEIGAYDSGGTRRILLSSGQNSYINYGNVGIGTTGPGAKLEVNGTILGRAAASGDNWGIYLRSHAGTTTARFDTSGSETNHALTLGTVSNNNMGFVTANSTRMTIDNSGNVGIGTAGPTLSVGRGLHISGVADSNTQAVIRLSETGSGLGNFEIRSNRSIANSGNMLQFGEGSDTFMTIRGDDDGGGTATRGNVGIGTTSPNYKLDVNGVVNASGFAVNGTPLASPMTLLKANSGSMDTLGSTTADTVAISGLTAKDTLLIYYTISAETQTATRPDLRTTTDSLRLIDLYQGGGNMVAGNYISAQATLRQGQEGSTTVYGSAVGQSSVGNSDAILKTTVTTAWTGSWTLGMYIGSGTTGGTFRWSWAVYKIAGQ